MCIENINQRTGEPSSNNSNASFKAINVYFLNDDPINNCHKTKYILLGRYNSLPIKNPTPALKSMIDNYRHFAIANGHATVSDIDKAAMINHGITDITKIFPDNITPAYRLYNSVNTPDLFDRIIFTDDFLNDSDGDKLQKCD